MANKSQSQLSLTLTISDEQSLYRAYMPFLKNGGLFVPTKDMYNLGQKVIILLSFMKQEKKVSGEVAWISPRVSQRDRESGVGVHFNQDANNTLLKAEIERYLATKLQSSKATNTM